MSNEKKPATSQVGDTNTAGLQAASKPEPIRTRGTFTLDVPSGAVSPGVNFQDPPTNSSADENYICEVSGGINTGDCNVSAIYVLNRETPFTLTGEALSTQIQTDGKLCPSDNIITPNTGGSWNFDKNSSPRIDGILMANGDDKTNYIAAVAIFESTSGCNAPNDGVIAGPVTWTATKCSGCPDKAKFHSVAHNEIKAGPAGTTPHLIAPTVDGDWLHYAINVQRRVGNFRLLDTDGVGYLKASEVAVAAQVQWRPSPNRELVIRDPNGISDCRPRDSVGGRRPLMRFQGLPKFSLVLWQPTPDPRPTVVTAQCRSNALEIALDPEREIVLELNDNNQSLLDNEGVIDLWVKLPGLGH